MFDRPSQKKKCYFHFIEFYDRSEIGYIIVACNRDIQIKSIFFQMNKESFFFYL